MELSSSIPKPQRPTTPTPIPARELDTEELCYYRARYYDPQIERFLDEDTIGLGSGDFNFYRYVNSSPITWIDGGGLITKKIDPTEAKQQAVLSNTF